MSNEGGPTVPQRKKGRPSREETAKRKARAQGAGASQESREVRQRNEKIAGRNNAFKELRIEKDDRCVYADGQTYIYESHDASTGLMRVWRNNLRGATVRRDLDPTLIQSVERMKGFRS